MRLFCSIFQLLVRSRVIDVLFFLVVTFSVQAQQALATNTPSTLPSASGKSVDNPTPILSPASPASLTPIPKTHFLHIAAINFLKVIPSPPKPDSKRQEEDRQLLHDVIATRTKGQVEKAQMAIKDSVFDYAAALGPNFNPATYPRMAKLFAKIKQDTNVAIHSAKNTFHRARPDTWAPTSDESENKKQEGFAYPSGHSTRAFLWAALLAHLFPDKQKEINAQARQKAWNRVVLGRHYPNDVYAGEVYGKYLAEELLKDPKFEQEWEAIQQEVSQASASNNVLPMGTNSSPTNAESVLVNEKQ